MNAPRPIAAPADRSSDAELAARICDGDTGAFEVIMRRHNRLLFRTARSILSSDAEAEDALQDAYLKAWRGMAGFRAEARLATWLVRIVTNEALARLRPRSAQVISLTGSVDDPDARSTAWAEDEDDAWQQPERHAVRAELRRLMEHRIDMLPAPFRTVFMLRAVEEWSVEEVAQALQIPETTVRTRFFRARSMLREGLSLDVDMAMADAFSFDGPRCDRIVSRVLAALSPDGGTP
jgi:RNA polymerase sigma-70 factor (ECF subfamily)